MKNKRKNDKKENRKKQMKRKAWKKHMKRHARKKKKEKMKKNKKERVLVNSKRGQFKRRSVKGLSIVCNFKCLGFRVCFVVVCLGFWVLGLFRVFLGFA